MDLTSGRKVLSAPYLDYLSCGAGCLLLHLRLGRVYNWSISIMLSGITLVAEMGRSFDTCYEYSLKFFFGVKKGMLVGVNHAEIMSLKQKLEGGQVKMQSRLEEVKAALMKIRGLTKLILVSSKNAIPGYLTDVPSQLQSHSVGMDDKHDALCDGMLIKNESQKDAFCSVVKRTKRRVLPS